MNRLDQRGLLLPLALMAIALTVIITIGGYLLIKNNNFFVNNRSINKQDATTPLPSSLNSKTNIKLWNSILDTNTWKTYTNLELGYEIKYPKDFEYHKGSEGNVDKTKYEEYVFTRIEDTQGFELPRFEVVTYKNEGLTIEEWLKNKWFEYDYDAQSLRDKYTEPLINPDIYQVNDSQGIRIMRNNSEDDAYFLFISNGQDKVVQLVCVDYYKEKGKEMAPICDSAFSTFLFR